MYIISPFNTNKINLAIIANVQTMYGVDNNITTYNKRFILFPPSLTLFISFTILNGVFIKKVAKYLKKI